MMPEILRRMPPVLRILFCVLVLLPFWTWAQTGASGSGMSGQNTGSLILTLTVTWILPWGTAIALVRCSPIALPLLALEFLGFITLAFLSEGPQWLTGLRAGLLVATGLMATLIVSRDTIFPLLGRGARFWRMYGRHLVSAPVTVEIDSPEETCDVTGELLDISQNGVGISIKSAQSAPRLLRRGDGVHLSVPGSPPMRLTAWTAWSVVRESAVLLGFRVDDAAGMAELHKKLGLDSSVDGWFANKWRSQGFRRLVLTLWTLALAGCFGLPLGL
jgi:hypothetical protein